ncbi:MAG: DUF481 domain-containing protein [Planctomycetota bacterium]|jgi:hypothetical protein
MRWVALLLLLTGCASTLEPYPGFEHVIAAEPKLNFDPKFDWVQLNSGEWLKGEITVLRDGSFEFDSDELDEQTFDWEDVREVRSSKSVTCTFENPKDPRKPLVVTGKVVATKDQIEIGGKNFKRGDLISLIPGEQKEWDYWSGKLTLNATVREGNTDQTDAGAYFRLLRRSPYSRLNFVYRGTFGKVGGVETVNNHLFTATWDLFISRKFYVTPAKVEIYSDVFQNISTRITPSAGVGYHVIDKPAMEWDIFGGIGWQFTRFDSVQAGQLEKVDQGIVVLGTKYVWDITSKTDLTLDYTAQLGVDDIQDSTQHLGVVLSSDIWGNLDLDVGFYWDWVGSPTTAEDGTTPEKSDYRMTIGVGWDF